MEQYLLPMLILLSALLLVAIILLIWMIRISGTARRTALSTRENRVLLDGLSQKITESTQSVKSDLMGEVKSVRVECVDTVRSSVGELGRGLREEQKASAAAQKDQFALSDQRQVDLQKAVTDLLSERITTLKETVDTKLTETNNQFKNFSEQSRLAQETSARSVRENLESMRRQNEEQLEKMRLTVDEKLQKTLNDRISESFKLVNDRLEAVYTGLGEMKTLAGDVGDLKKVMSGVKTRGILGEVQLGAIISEILTRGQYEENIATKAGSTERVEFAVCLPGSEENEHCYLPIDAKFPGDAYQHLLDAYDSTDKDQIAEAKAALRQRLRQEARDIRDKYIDPPGTTQFGILFLPFEGLYAEAVQMGISEELQKDFHVSLAGPTTLSALLNSLQMGFHTLAIQRRSGEIEKVLGAVKTEFGKFEGALTDVQRKIDATSNDLEKLVGVRTRQINRKLRGVTELPQEDASALLPVDGDDGTPEDA